MASREDLPNLSGKKAYYIMKGSLETSEQVGDLVDTLVEHLTSDKEKIDVYAAVGLRTMTKLQEELKKDAGVEFVREFLKVFSEDLCLECKTHLLEKTEKGETDEDEEKEKNSDEGVKEKKMQEKKRPTAAQRIHQAMLEERAQKELGAIKKPTAKETISQKDLELTE